jgi:hypothetical protein
LLSHGSKSRAGRRLQRRFDAWRRFPPEDFGDFFAARVLRRAAAAIGFGYSVKQF